MNTSDVAVRSTINVTIKTSFTYYSTSKVRGILSHLIIHTKVQLLCHKAKPQLNMIHYTNNDLFISF